MTATKAKLKLSLGEKSETYTSTEALDHFTQEVSDLLGSGWRITDVDFQGLYHEKGTMEWRATISVEQIVVE